MFEIPTGLKTVRIAISLFLAIACSRGAEDPLVKLTACALQELTISGLFEDFVREWQISNFLSDIS